MITIEERRPQRVSGVTSFFVTFDYSPEIIDAIKTVPNAYFHKKEKSWEIPACHLALLLDTLCFKDEILLKCLDSEPAKKTKRYKLTKKEIAGFKYEPFKHQLEAINYGLDKFYNEDGRGFLLLMSMGTGKSLIMMYLAEVLHKRGLIDHCLIVCGVASLRQNWKKEIRKFSNESVRVLGEKVSKKSGRTGYATIPERIEAIKNPIEEFFVVTNIELFQNKEFVNALNKSGKFQMIAFDEAHRGSKTSQMGTNFLEAKAKYKVAATGTLITNNPQSAYIPLKWTGNEASGFTNYKNTYCEYGGFNNYQVIGYKNLDLLRDELNSCAIRKTLEQVRDDMPSKTVEAEIVELDDNHRRFYDAIKAGVKEEADKVELNLQNLLSLAVRLRQATSCPGFLDSHPPESCKIRRCAEIAEDLATNGEKVVILCTFKETVKELGEKLAKLNPLLNSGDFADDIVSANIDEFQNNPEAKIFIGTWSKCSTGITLNAASYMICVDTPYTDAQFQQGCDRIYRVTNTKPVFIKVLICKDTVDERVWNIVEHKRDLSGYLVDGKNAVNDEEITSEFVKQLANIVLE